MKPDLKTLKDQLTIVFYTSNYLQDKNPYFFDNCVRQLLLATEDLPIVCVSHRPINFEPYCKDIGIVGKSVKNIVVDLPRHHLSIYKQILIGAKEAKTPYVATAEDDILYSWEHYHHRLPKTMDTYLYDMNRVSIFTWTKPPMFSYRYKRTVVNQLIAPRQMLIDNMEERFARWPSFVKEKGGDEENCLKYFADPGRYEDILGITPRKIDTFMSTKSSIVYSHEFAYGFEKNQGKKKRLGDLRIMELQGWPRPEEMLKMFYKKGNFYDRP